MHAATCTCLEIENHLYIYVFLYRNSLPLCVIPFCGVQAAHVMQVLHTNEPQGNALYIIVTSLRNLTTVMQLLMRGKQQASNMTWFSMAWKALSPCLHPLTNPYMPALIRWCLSISEVVQLQHACVFLAHKSVKLRPCMGTGIELRTKTLSR